MNPNFFSQTFRAISGYPGEPRNSLGQKRPRKIKTPRNGRSGKGPKIEKTFQDLPLGLKFSSENENFKRAPHQSERPRSLVLSLRVPSRPSPVSNPRARPGPIPGPKGSRPDSPCALFLQRFGPIQVPRWGPSRPVLVPSCSRAFLPGSGLDGPKQTSWPFPNRDPYFVGDSEGRD